MRPQTAEHRGPAPAADASEGLGPDSRGEKPGFMRIWPGGGHLSQGDSGDGGVEGLKDGLWSVSRESRSPFGGSITFISRSSAAESRRERK